MEKPFQLLNPEFEAEIYYLTKGEGGRKSAVATGYRGQFFYDGKHWDAPQEFLEKDVCKLGETVRVLMQTYSPASHLGKLYVGKQFEIKEGNRTVGKGVITKIFRQDFNIS